MFDVMRENRAAVIAAAVTVIAVIATVAHLRAGGGGANLPGAALAAANRATSTQPPVRGAAGGSADDATDGTASASGPSTPTPGANTPPPSPCGHDNFVFTLTTDKSIYHSGETVWVSMTATYNGPGCAYGNECIPFGIVRNAASQAIATTMTPRHCGEFPPLTLSKGTKLQERYPWDQQPLNASGTATTGQEVPRGAYTITADWHSIGLSRSVTVQLVA